MTNEPSASASQDPQDPIEDRDHLLEVLGRAGVLNDQVRAAVAAMDLPALLSEVEERLLQVGITHSVLVDAMGGSP